jgi:membrane-bound lytic murein transglycosylase B
VAVPATGEGEAYLGLLDAGLKPSLKPAALREAGVAALSEPAIEADAALVALEVEGGTELWLGYNNFYVITRYNRSPLYAMAVHQLAQEIRQARSTAMARAAQ